MFPYFSLENETDQTQAETVFGLEDGIHLAGAISLCWIVRYMITEVDYND
jgi:hypothetical protein